MIDYRFQGRLSYIPGGALNVQMSAWPVAGANWWEPTTGSYTVVAAYQAKGAASLAASYVNLANPGTYDLTEGNAPTFDTSYGWAFDGSADYLRTGINPSGTNKQYSMFVRYSNWDSSGAYYDRALAGMFSGGTNSFLIFMQSATRIDFYSSGSRSYIGPTHPTSGVLGIAGNQGYYNGSAYGLTISAGSDLASVTIDIGSTAGTRLYKGRIQAVAIYSTELSSTQVAEITDNMEAL